MDIWLGRMALFALVIYVAASVLAALRMYFVHSHYVHVELAGKKWRTFGSWAPRQYKRLSVLRGIALVMIVAWLAGLAYSIIYTQ